MSHVVDVLAHRESTLGVLPLGTGNSFARSLGLNPHDLEAAVATIARGETARIDLGTVNGAHFANVATIGLSSEVAGATSTRLKAISGVLAYVLAAWRPLVGHQAFRARIRWKGGKLQIRTRDIVIANGRYFGSAPVSADASLTSGRLSLYATDDPSRTGAIVTYLAFGVHAQDALAGAHVINAPAFEIRTRKRQAIALDGSVFRKTPARVKVARRALRVYVPAKPVPTE